MVFPKVVRSVLAAGMLTVGTFAGGGAVGSNYVPRPSSAAVPSKAPFDQVARETTASEPRDHIPAYLLVASQQWTRTHDSRRVRRTLQLALEELDASDGARGSASVASANDDGQVAAQVAGPAADVLIASRSLGVADLAHRLAPLAIFRLPTPVVISLGSSEHHSRYADGRGRWDAWRFDLRKVSPLPAGTELSAIEIAIETQQ